MKVSPAARRKARHFGMQALYQWQMNSAPINTIEAEFCADNDMTHTDTDYFHELLHKIPASVTELEEAYTPYLQGREYNEIDAITRALLLMACYELTHRIDVPYKVVINEAVSLAKKFGATDSYKFINGVLDQLAAALRTVEVNAEKRNKPA